MTSAGLISIFLGVALCRAQVPARNPDFNRIAVEAGRATEAGELSKAERLYQRGLQLRPAWAEGWWSLGGILYSEQRFAEALGAFQHFAAP